MAEKAGYIVTGDKEVITALNKVAAFDVGAAETAAVNAMVPAVSAKTRKNTGALAAGWSASNGAFVNTVSYAVVQEFGGVYIEPTNAVQQTWDQSQDAALSAFEKEIDSAAAQAGFDT